MNGDDEAMDAYSRTIVRVAETVLPSVASLAVRSRRGQGAGSASVITADGFLLTSAHVVEGADEAEASFADGTEVTADVVGRDPLSDLAVLADSAGRMVGVNTAVAGIGLGLAVPVNDTTRGLITTLMTQGRVRRAWLGIAGQQIALPPVAAAKVGSRKGLQVAQVISGSPAEEAGLRRGDIVISVDGRPVGTSTAVQQLMVEGAIGRRLEVTVLRNGALVDAVAVPRELPER